MDGSEDFRLRRAASIGVARRARRSCSFAQKVDALGHRRSCGDGTESGDMHVLDLAATPADFDKPAGGGVWRMHALGATDCATRWETWAAAPPSQEWPPDAKERGVDAFVCPGRTDTPILCPRCAFGTPECPTQPLPTRMSRFASCRARPCVRGVRGRLCGSAAMWLDCNGSANRTPPIQRGLAPRRLPFDGRGRVRAAGQIDPRPARKNLIQGATQTWIPSIHEVSTRTM
jgi:hypothetical protein